MSFSKQLSAWFSELNHNLVTHWGHPAFLKQCPRPRSCCQEVSHFHPLSSLHHLESPGRGNCPVTSPVSEFSIHHASPASILTQPNSTSNSQLENEVTLSLALAFFVLQTSLRKLGCTFQKQVGIIKEEAVSSTLVECQGEV